MQKAILIKQLFRYITHFDEKQLADLLMAVGFIVASTEKQYYPDSKEDFPVWLKMNLEKSNINISDFSRICGVHRRSIHRYLIGNSMPTPEHYKKMVLAFEQIEHNSKNKSAIVTVKAASVTAPAS